jgi:hypothetical protein
LSNPSSPPTKKHLITPSPSSYDIPFVIQSINPSIVEFNIPETPSFAPYIYLTDLPSYTNTNIINPKSNNHHKRYLELVIIIPIGSFICILLFILCVRKKRIILQKLPPPITTDLPSVSEHKHESPENKEYILDSVI